MLEIAHQHTDLRAGSRPAGSSKSVAPVRLCRGAAEPQYVAARASAYTFRANGKVSVISLP